MLGWSPLSDSDTSDASSTKEPTARAADTRVQVVVLMTVALLFMTVVFWSASGGLGGIPPFFYWFFPALYLAAYAGFSKGLTDFQRLAGFVPVLAFLGMFGVIRSLPEPWWTSHGIMAFLFLAVGVSLRSPIGVPWHLVVIGVFVTVVGLFPSGRRGAFWADCRELEHGMDIVEVMEVLHDQYLLDPESMHGEDRFPVRDLNPADWSGYERLTFGHSGMNADECWVTFREDRVVRVVTSPD